jgi:2-polyprenyl-3-methyl-5-hydroxy-6-metoxy-1,4-benzoquinol methylase
MNADKAGRQYWDGTPRNMDVEFTPFRSLPGIRGFARRRWDQAFRRSLGRLGRGRRILELGCGGSAYLPYFATEFGLEVCGIDYSEGGCGLAREMCRRNGVQAKVICANFFDVPSEFEHAFDAVASFGVVEHFTDTAGTIRKFAEYLQPGGLLVTVVPNMSGLVGLGQRVLNEKVFHTHEVVTPDRLRLAYEAAGLDVIENDYFLFCNFGVISPGADSGAIRKTGYAALRGLTALIWGLEWLIGAFPANRISSPYVWCVGRRPMQPV